MNHKNHFSDVAERSASNFLRAEENLALLEQHGITGPVLEEAALEAQLAAAFWAEAGRRTDRVNQGLAPDPFPNAYALLH